MLIRLLKSLLGGASGAAAAGAASAPVRAPSGPDFVGFITSVEELHLFEEGETFDSAMASMRLRVAIPARELARRLSVFLVPIDYVRTNPGLNGMGTPRAVVVGNLPLQFFTGERDRATALIEWIESASAARRVVVDFSDNLAAPAVDYARPDLLEVQKRLLGACHATVPTESLRRRLMPHAKHGVSVIEDPFESARAGEPRLDPGAVLRLAWFGVFASERRPFVEAQLGNIASRLTGRPTELAFVTHAAQSALVGDMGAALRAINPAFRVRHVPWSLEATARELDGADVVVLPQDATSDWGRLKSHNRLVESIRAGRFVVASAIPAYLELSSYAWIGNDLGNGIEWVLANPAEALHRIREGQSYVADRFAPQRIGARWAQVLEL